MPGEDVCAWSGSPPPYLQQDEGPAASLTLYAFTHSAPHNHQASPSVTVLQFRERVSRQVRYAITIPKKREGWKAEVSFVTEKERTQLICEVRREPLARKYDFRDPEGNHNVMVPSTSLSNKTFSFEALDGQKLMWKRAALAWSLVSMPSQKVMARYSMMDGAAGPVMEQGGQVLGSLVVYELAAPAEAAVSAPRMHQRHASTMSASSSASSTEGPRLGRANISLAVGLCAPATIGASVASPHSSAGMNRFCLIGDELTNLGRASIQLRTQTQEDQASQAARSKWADLNRSSFAHKNNDPRPRNVDVGLIVSSLVAVLAG